MAKLLLYCVKSKPYLIGRKDAPYKYYLDRGGKDSDMDGRDFIHNGKIVAECDFEVEEISKVKDVYDDDYIYETPTLNYNELLKKSCLNNNQLEDYLEFNGYAIHIKNLNIFDEARELKEYINNEGYPLKKAPQNMMYAKEIKLGKKIVLGKELNNVVVINNYILISIRPEYLVKILNKEKTIEIRKKVLKEMIK